MTITIRQYKSNWKRPGEVRYVKDKGVKEGRLGVLVMTTIEESKTFDEKNMVCETSSFPVWSDTPLAAVSKWISDFSAKYEQSFINLSQTSWSDSGADLIISGKREPTAEELKIFTRLKAEYEHQENIVKGEKQKKEELAELKRLKDKYENPNP